MAHLEVILIGTKHCTVPKSAGLLRCLQMKITTKLQDEAKMNVTFERGSAQDPSVQSSLC